MHDLYITDLPTQIMWKAVNSSSAPAGYMSMVMASSQGSSTVLTGLDRLTVYTVFMYANNSQGMSRDSLAVTLSTSATGTVFGVFVVT